MQHRIRIALFAVPLLAFLSGGIVFAQTGADARARNLPLVEVYKNPYCGCCGGWVAHMEKAGFTVKVHEVEDLAPLRKRLGIPDEHASCHSAKVGAYALEGHVPADDVKRLLTEKPQAIGLVVPGMPAGSPGMEIPSGAAEPYASLLLKRDAPTEVYVRHENQESADKRQKSKAK
ncbi:periplasmic protein [Betaproteobacteria bacterium]|nr:periplasmic protein [Betaproteobacteria bacterium]GHU41698.1 periplasmic protein [Betaproteobacteria bacterium]